MPVDASRPQTIPGVTFFRRREDWQDPNLPVTGPAQTLSQVDTFPLHYTAADNVPDGDGGGYYETQASVADRLRASQRDYKTNRGYSLGYGFCVDQWGGVWEIRGYDIKNAANRNWNHRTLPVLCLVDGADPLTPAAIRSVNALYAEANRRTGRHLNLVGHRDIGATACPGDGIYAQIQSGVIRPDTGQLPPPKPPLVEPTPEPDPEEDDMTKTCVIWNDLTPGGDAAVYLVGPGGVAHLDGLTKNHLVAQGVPQINGTNTDVSASYRRVARGLA